MKSPNSCPHWDSNPLPQNFKSILLTARPLCIHRVLNYIFWHLPLPSSSNKAGWAYCSKLLRDNVDEDDDVMDYMRRKKDRNWEHKIDDLMMEDL